MPLQHGVAERLLTGADGAGPQPVWVRNVRRVDDVCAAGVGDPRRGQNMRDNVERPEGLAATSRMAVAGSRAA